MSPVTKKKLGDLLLEKGVIDEIQLKAALGHQKKWGCRIGTSFLELGFLTEEALTQHLSTLSHVPGVEVLHARIPPEVFKLIPKETAVKYTVVPIALKDTPGKKTLVVATANPSDLAALDYLESMTRCRIEPRVAPESTIKKRLQHYGDEARAPHDIGEVPRADTAESEPKAETRVEEVTLTEEVTGGQGEDDSVIIVDDAPVETLPGTPPEEPVALTEVSSVQTPSPPSPPPPRREEAPPPPAVEPTPAHAEAAREAPPPAAEPARSRRPDPFALINALLEEISGVKDSISVLEGRVSEIARDSRQDASREGLSDRIDALARDMSGIGQSRQELQEAAAQIRQMEASKIDVKNLLQVLLNFLLDKGVFTKDELLAKLKK